MDHLIQERNVTHCKVHKWRERISITNSMDLLSLLLFSPSSSPTLCSPTDCSMPDWCVLHYLPEFAQALVYWVGNAIQPSHLLSSPLPPAFNLSQHQGLSNELALHIRWPKYRSFSYSINPSNEYSGLLSLGLTVSISLQSNGFLEVFSNTTFQKHQSLALSFLYSPTLTSIHDYWKKP